jgi:predicted CxxxxCH...CXXCH cytochrome family protein
MMSITAGLALIAVPMFAGQYHSGQTLYCADCHTMHFSMQHGYGSGNPVGTKPPTGGPTSDWLGATGPNNYLLKAPANTLCLQCHDNQTFAPDVYGLNSNADPSQGRAAGAVNDPTLGTPYETWKGHTLGATTTPPGFDPAVVGLSPTWYNPAGGLDCVSCHAQHGPATAYRNLGAYALGATAGNFRPTYVIGTTNDTTKDVWVNLASYTAGSGNAATFNPYYDYANISFNRNDAVVGSTKSSNRMDTFCASCHGDFHGGPGDTGIGATAAALDGFIRHPTSQVTIGAAGGQGYGGHSSLAWYTSGTTKARVYASDHAGWTDAAPGCLTCHKAHGNQNPFGLFFLNRNATSVNDQGGLGTGQTASNELGMRNLCGQCHVQGN